MVCSWNNENSDKLTWKILQIAICVFGRFAKLYSNHCVHFNFSSCCDIIVPILLWLLILIYRCIQLRFYILKMTTFMCSHFWMFRNCETNTFIDVYESFLWHTIWALYLWYQSRHGRSFFFCGTSVLLYLIVSVRSTHSSISFVAI